MKFNFNLIAATLMFNGILAQNSQDQGANIGGAIGSVVGEATKAIVSVATVIGGGFEQATSTVGAVGSGVVSNVASGGNNFASGFQSGMSQGGANSASKSMSASSTSDSTTTRLTLTLPVVLAMIVKLYN